jgi:hypothetical protein
MADDVWGRPRIPTGESVAAALRLAKELKPDASLLCEGADGTTELLVRKDGCVERYVAYRSGATQQLERRERSPRYRSGKRLIYIGLASIPLLLAAGAVFSPQYSALWMLPFLLGVGLVIGGALLCRQWAEIDAPDGVVSARIPYDLGGWEPLTVAQLAAVEELSESSNEHARVRSLADGRVEVETFRKRERRLHVLDAHGNIVDEDTAVVAGGIYWTPKLAALALIIPFGARWMFDGARYFLIGLAGYVLILVLASRVDARKHVALPGEEWFEIQLEAPSGD